MRSRVIVSPPRIPAFERAFSKPDDDRGRVLRLLPPEQRDRRLNYTPARETRVSPPTIIVSARVPTKPRPPANMWMITRARLFTFSVCDYFPIVNSDSRRVSIEFGQRFSIPSKCTLDYYYWLPPNRVGSSSARENKQKEEILYFTDKYLPKVEVDFQVVVFFDDHTTVLTSSFTWYSSHHNI